MKRPLILAAAMAALVASAPAQEKSALDAAPEGWIELLPPPDFQGWTRIPFPPTAGISQPTQWRVDPQNHMLICTGRGGHEWLRWDTPVRDFILHVEWRFAPRSPEEKGYNSGVGVRMSPFGEVWFQAQAAAGGGFLFGNTLVDGKLARLNLSREMKENRVKPAGEWNTYEIHAVGDTLRLWVNGAEVSVMKNVPFLEGHVGFEAEFYEIAFRNIRLKVLN